MSEEKLREMLDKVWNALGEYAMKNEAFPNPGVLCDAIAEVLNDTDPNLQGSSEKTKELYSTYQPIEVLQFIKNRKK